MKKPVSHTVSRRAFVAGAAATAAVAATPALSGCGGGTSATEELLQGVIEQFPNAQVEYLAVDFDQINPHTEMENVDNSQYLIESNSFTLPLGSLVYQSSDSKALVLSPGASSRALICLGVVDLDSGEHTVLLEQALGFNEDYIIYDARASDDALIWVECNMVHGLWRVYATSFSDGVVSEEHLQEAQLLDEGEEDYSPPLLAAASGKVYWTVMPDPNGPASSEDSYLKAAEISKGKEPQAKTVYTSHGRMITTPVVSGDVLAFVPRVDTDMVYYQLTTMNITSDEVLNISILPQSLRVANAAWLEHGFAFGIEGNYDYANGLSFFGTYEQLEEGKYLYVNKAPVSAPVSMGKTTYVKSTKNVLGIKADQGEVAIVDTIQDCVSYGDNLAGAGTQKRLVLYTTLNPKTGQSTGTCMLRVFDSL